MPAISQAGSRHRCRVPTPTSSSRDTTSSDALSGGSNFATALSLNACPYRTKSVLHRRPVGWSMEATTILPRGQRLVSPEAAVASPGALTLALSLKLLPCS